MEFLRLCKEEVDPEGAAKVQEALSLDPSEVLAEIFYFYNPIRVVCLIFQLLWHIETSFSKAKAS